MTELQGGSAGYNYPLFTLNYLAFLAVFPGIRVPNF